MQLVKSLEGEEADAVKPAGVYDGCGEAGAGVGDLGGGGDAVETDQTEIGVKLGSTVTEDTTDDRVVELGSKVPAIEELVRDPRCP